MPTATQYRDIVAAYRIRQLRWETESVERIRRILTDASLAIELEIKRLGEKAVTSLYKESLLQSMRSALDDLHANESDLTKIHLLQSAQNAADREAEIVRLIAKPQTLDAYLEGLAPQVSESVEVKGIGRISASVGRISEESVNAVYQRVLDDGLHLSERLWQNNQTARTALEDLVTQAIAENKSARKLALEIRQHLTEEGQANARYNSERLAVTEINNAHREAHARSLLTSDGRLKDFASGIGWRLSSSHRQPDICDVWASQDIDGLGPGNYYPQNMPVDHPWGHCHTVTLLEDYPEEQFVVRKAKPDGVSAAELKRYGIDKQDEEG